MTRVALVCDLLEENWPSMELVADMLFRNLSQHYASTFEPFMIRPPLARRFSRFPFIGRTRAAHNADRLIGRLRDYPRYIRNNKAGYDLFHVCDHSYAHLVHDLPASQTGVFCHDLDTFRCLLQPEKEQRPAWFKRMARHILGGLQKAKIVFYTTATVRKQIEKHGLLDPASLVQAGYGISPEFGVERNQSSETLPLPVELEDTPFLLHVGSCIARKRIDVLLQVFAEVRSQHPELLLLQVGGEWTEAQTQQIKRLGIRDAVRQVPRQSHAVIAELYRRATLVLMPSEAEGFGLPVIEALACGSIVVASDIPVFREVGQDAVVYCNLDDIAAWVDTVSKLATNPLLSPNRSTRLEQAGRFSWEEHTRIVVQAYQHLM